MEPAATRFPVWDLIDAYLASPEGSEPPLLEMANLFRWRFRGSETDAEPAAQKVIRDIWGMSVVLLLALDGERPEVARLERVFRFATETHIGLALAVCAGEARRGLFGPWAAFRASLRLPGFFAAFAEWLPHAPPEPGLPQVFRGIRKCWKADPESLPYARWEAALEKLAAGGPEAMEAVAAAWANDQRTEKQTSKRQAQKPNDGPQRSVTATVRQRWISHALWCRTTKGIQQALFPVGKGVHARIDAAITEHGFASTRRPEHEAAIEWAERNARSFFPPPRPSSGV